MSDEWDDIERAKAASTFQILFRCARLANEQALDRLRDTTGMAGLRASHTGVFPHIDPNGTRLVVLAQRLGVSKQAAGQLVDELVAMKVLERVPDPTDGRAKLIRFPRGALLHGLGVLQAYADEAADALGHREMGELHTQLGRLLAWLERGANVESDDGT